MRDRAGFTLLEVLLAACILALAAASLGTTFSLVSTGYLRSTLNREAIVWHNSYALGIAKGEIDRAAQPGSSQTTQTFTLPSGATVSVTDKYLTSEPTAPNVLYVQSTASWTVPGGTGTATSTITVARGTAPSVH